MSEKGIRGAQTEYVYNFSLHMELTYLLFLPYSYQKSRKKKYPLIFYLHGQGEWGSDITLLKRQGLPKIVEDIPRFPFVVLSPQCPENTYWSDHHFALIELLDAVCQTYRIDQNRIYLTGNSMGGFGVWSLASDYAERFAAIAPICGSGIPDFAEALVDVPVWAFHGQDDPIVAIRWHEQMVRAVEEAGGSVRFTVYPNTGHDAWTPTYANPELYQWFLSHHL